MKFEDMNPLQRRLHNAAIVLDAEGDEHGFAGLLREAIAAEKAQGVEPCGEREALIKRLREGQAYDYTSGHLLDMSCAMDDAADMLEADAQNIKQQVAVPQGWKLVPVEPTEDMISAGKRPQHGNGNPHDKAKRVYRAMLAAAPQPPKADAQEVDWEDMYHKQKREKEAMVAKYEKDIGPLVMVVPTKP